jgi:hypothetical protein
MTEHEASRTLVKSPPELWAELSDESSLGRHFDQFGEISITRLEPETAVAWEGERVSGTVRLEPSGWGTKVILTARAVRAVDARAPEPLPPVGSTAAPPAGQAKQGCFARLLGFLGGPRPEPVAMVEPPVVAVEPSVVAVEPPVGHPIDAAGVLAAALDSLGQAHHRPFSRG